jgi:predicted metalloendopeptidase
MVLESMDWNVDPCNDFYNFSCGGWLNTHTIPNDKSRYYRSFNTIDDFNEAILKKILEGKAIYPKINNFYNACMNLTEVNRIDITPLSTYLDTIENIDNIEDTMYMTGLLHSLGVNAFFNLNVDRDSGHPEIDIALFSQGGISLPDISLYQDNDLLDQYLTHIQNIFILYDFFTFATAQKALALESELSKIMVPNTDLIDPFAVYNKINMTGLKSISNLPWDFYLDALGYTNLDQLSVDVPNFFAKLANVISNNIDNVPSYLRWKLIHQYVNQLSQDYVDENFFFFGKILNGQQAPTPRWKDCLLATDSSMPELTGYEYSQQAFSGESRNIASQMIEEIEKAMNDDLNTIPWMDSVTRVNAIDKLKAIANMIGYPDPPYTYPNFNPKSDTYLQNTIDSLTTSIKRKLDNVGKTSNRFLWGMSPDTVNAYYDPTRNEMVFPSGIMQTPFFNKSFPLSMNFGGIGMVMGHELTHAFDNQGRDYDLNGVLRDWWTNETSQKFNSKVQCVIDQYSKFEILPKVFVDGKLTQGENIADMGGIKNAFYSYVEADGDNSNKPSIVPKLTNKQLFFVSFAQNWCSLTRPATQVILIKVDPHSPSRFRVMGPLINLPEFADTFQCKKGSTMNPDTHCEV